MLLEAIVVSTGSLPFALTHPPAAGNDAKLPLVRAWELLSDGVDLLVDGTSDLTAEYSMSMSGSSK